MLPDNEMVLLNIFLRCSQCILLIIHCKMFNICAKIMHIQMQNSLEGKKSAEQHVLQHLEF